MKHYIRDTHARGGITTLSWHADNIATGGSSWDCKQDTVVRSILEGGVHHKQYLTWLGKVAAFFLDLKDENGVLIPVIFRMFHEHTGDWFWWCSKQCTPEEYKALWRMTADYLQKTKQVHNLIYAYSSSSGRDEAHYLERYPGDDYADIVAYDCYVQGKDSTAVAKYKEAMDHNLKIITGYAAKSGKLPAIGETGMESIPDPTYFTQTVYPVISRYKIAWILFWRNALEKDRPDHFYVPFAGHLSEDDFIRFVNEDNILMNKDAGQTEQSENLR
jgi:mannan endo-1,4-beta-mannosidase